MSDVYTVDPHSVVFDDKYAVFNPLHNELEYAATKENIVRVGQLDPVLMLDGKCVDGRHRVRVAKELGVHVKCVDIDARLPDEDIIVMCNKNVMSGRDYDVTQKAIQALQLVSRYKMTAVAAARLMKVDHRALSYASTIKGFDRHDILDTLMANKQNRIQLDNMERPSRSLEILAKYVKTVEERPKLVVDDSERIHWDAEAAIKTELGKARYYEMLKAVEAIGPIKMQMLFVELVNLTCKLGDTEV